MGSKNNNSREYICKESHEISIPFRMNILIIMEALLLCFVLGFGRGSRLVPFLELREGIAGAAVSLAPCSRAHTCRAYRCIGHHQDEKKQMQRKRDSDFFGKIFAQLRPEIKRNEGSDTSTITPYLQVGKWVRACLLYDMCLLVPWYSACLFIHLFIAFSLNAPIASEQIFIGQAP
jgi:hypothetical protein